MDLEASVMDRDPTSFRSEPRIGPPHKCWPATSFSAVPDLAVAHSLAVRVRRAAGSVTLRDAEAGRIDLKRLERAGGFRTDLVDLGVAQGGPQALLQPAYDHGFRICADPTPRTRGLEDVSGHTRRHRLRFLTAHEIGHTFFYDRTPSTPRRLFPIGSDSEEAFCNEFARALLVPPEAIRGLKLKGHDVFALAEKFDVSAELAARSIAAFHPRKPLVALGFVPRGSAEMRIQWTSRKDASSRVRAAALLGAGIAGPDRSDSMRDSLSRAADEQRRQVAVVA